MGRRDTGLIAICGIRLSCYNVRLSRYIRERSWGSRIWSRYHSTVKFSWRKRSILTPWEIHPKYHRPFLEIVISWKRVWRYHRGIRIHKSKDRQHIAKRKGTNNDLQNIHKKLNSGVIMLCSCRCQQTRCRLSRL